MPVWSEQPSRGPMPQNGTRRTFEEDEQLGGEHREQPADEQDEDELPGGSITMACVFHANRLGAAWFDPCTCSVRNKLAAASPSPAEIHLTERHAHVVQEPNSDHSQDCFASADQRDAGARRKQRQRRWLPGPAPAEGASMLLPVVLTSPRCWQKCQHIHWPLCAY